MIERRSAWRETYYTIRCFTACGFAMWAGFHNRLLPALVSLLVCLVWLFKANNESCKP